MGKRVKPASGPSLDVLESMLEAGAVDEAHKCRLPLSCGSNLANRLYSRGWMDRDDREWWVTNDGFAAVAAAKEPA